MSAIQAYRANCCCTYRWLARASAAILAVTWLLAVLWEGIPDHGVNLPLAVQTGIIAVVFGGYALGLRYELAGAIVSLVGVFGFFAANKLLLGAFPTLGFAWFALPAVLLIVSWELQNKERRETAPSDPA